MKAKNSHPESAARSVYERMIGVFFFFKPIPDLDEIVHQDFSGYGTAAHEFFKTRKDVIQMAITQAEQLQQQKIEIIRKPILERFLIDGTTYLIVEEFELYLVQDDHRLSTRLSTILEHINDKWMVTHFHGSTPDSNIAEEEAFPMEGLRKKNEALEAKIKERTRDLEIEGALERVRTRTMAMHKSEELAETAIVLYEQFSLLGNIPDRMSICIFKEDSRKLEFWPTDQSGSKLNNKFAGSWERSPIMIKIYNAWKAKDSSLVADLSGQDLKEWLKFIREEVKLFVDDTHIKGRRVQQAAFFSHGFLLITTNEPIADEIMQLLIRFAGVFSQTYTRFLDLQKAEAQAREAQIEGALERVRTRTMAMHNTDDIAETVTTFFNELLGLHPDSSIRCGIGILSQSEHMELWTASVKGGSETVLHAGTLDMSIHPLLKGVKETWSKKKKSFTYTLKGKEVKTYFQILNEAPDYPAHFDLKAIPKVVHHNSFVFRDGVLFVFTGNVLQDDIRLILERFTAVFGQTYTRYLDLKKAEAQARESQIQLSLERVRAKSLAMQSSDELHEVLGVLFRQFDNLGIHPVNVFLSLFDRQERTLTYRASGKSGKRIPGKQIVHVDSMEALQTLYDKWLNENSDTIEVIYYPKEVLPQLFGIFSETFSSMPKADRISVEDFPDGGYSMAGYTPFGYLGYDHQREATTEEKEILSRFCNEFTRIYQRFLDLQKAEAHARESQIEAALEKVRSQSLAMHTTSEMQQVANAVYDQLRELGLKMDAVGMSGVIEVKQDYDVWIGGAPMGKALRIPYNEDTKVQRDYNKAIKDRADLFARTYNGKIKEEYINHLLTHGEFPKVLKKKMVTSTDFSTSIAFSKNSGIQIARYTNEPYTAEENELLKRFAKVFEQAYIRFMDLQKAETQAREAQIEGALERIRSRTMAMHNSNDLEEIVISLFVEVLKLGLDKSLRCGIGILEGHERMETRSVNANPDGTLELKTGMLNMSIHPMLVGLKKAWKNGKKGYSYEYSAKDVRKYYEALNNEPDYPFNADLKSLPKQEFHRSFFFSSGIIFAFSETPISEESSKILARFAAVFGQTYQRFLDLQKAEERAKDAIKQASLDRVRGQIASMRSAEDLERITPLVFNELTTLGIPFIRCGVFIIEESNKTVRAFLSAPDGRSLGAMQIPFDAEKNTAETVAHWRKGEVYRTHWDKRQFLEFMQTMIDLGQVNNNKEYQGAEEPPESLHLHFVPFRQGMLYVGSEASLTVEQIELVQSLADAFAIAYARYEDFDKLEKAKERVETALSELKTTQNQLVQSEKMASLGELTAGIAHEIQNPLNFVNNFSEVSVELIEEMLEEIQKGDVEEVKALAEDIIQNLEKINHHGQRADGIVKGMLQHSRASSGEKEPTDINVLTDEYLRLAYHGLRAKDKTFNAALETDFDETIGKVNVIPQDMGRVILNLITNAFYVVKEKSSIAKASEDDTYEPTVTVSTKKTKKGIEIRVKDNGNGIPEGIKEKIFQPFFTTKPTGQGTGLGLSMSYDIVTKGHKGELKVNSKEGEGTTFTIVLPIVKETKKSNK